MRFAALRESLLMLRYRVSPPAHAPSLPRTACASRPAAHVQSHGADAPRANPMTNTTN